MKLYELLSICNNSENTIIVKKEKEILFKIETKTGEGIKFSGIDTLKQLEYALCLKQLLFMSIRLIPLFVFLSSKKVLKSA